MNTNLENLHDDEGFDAFNDVPVEEFGAALLAGYGWKKGMKINRNAKEDTKLHEFKGWNSRDGLAFPYAN